MILFHVPSIFILSVTLIKNKNEMPDSPPTKILCFYGTWQTLFEEMESEGVKFFQGLRRQDIVNSDGQHCMVILDDLQHKQPIVNLSKNCLLKAVIIKICLLFT